MNVLTKILLLSACGLSLTTATAQAPPTNFTCQPFERHSNLRWDASTAANVSGYQIYRSSDSIQFNLIKTVGSGTRFTTDWTGAPGSKYWYRIRTQVQGGATGDYSPTLPAQTFEMNDDQLLDMVQRQTLRYFWEFGHPVSGMARERNASAQTVTTGGTGFGIMAIVVGVERGWISRTDAVSRMLQLVSFLQFADRYHGAFPHWMDGTTGNTIPFSQFDDGADLVETAFLMQGLLTAREYFNQSNNNESALRSAITGLWEDVEWDWFRKDNSNVLYWHWSPNFGWQMNFALRGFNETHIVYLLAAASPTHPVPGSLYQTGWTGSNYANPSIQYGQKVYCGPFGGGPMFFAHYSYLGFDPRYVKDATCNYFVRNRNHALIQHAYAVANPKQYEGYGTNCWGLTACDGPNGYSAHDIHPNSDEGTIAPTAALASMPYTKAESMAAMRHFYRELGEKLWGDYGFRDAFNLELGWYADSYLAIDQGPIVVMLENARTGLLWEKFMQNSEIQPALTALGFQEDNASVAAQNVENGGFSAKIAPNPAPLGGAVQIDLHVPYSTTLHVYYIDQWGRKTQVNLSESVFAKGQHTLIINSPMNLMQQPGLGWFCIEDHRHLTTRLPLFTYSH